MRVLCPTGRSVLRSGGSLCTPRSVRRLSEKAENTESRAAGNNSIGVAVSCSVGFRITIPPHWGRRDAFDDGKDPGV